MDDTGTEQQELERLKTELEAAKVEIKKLKKENKKLEGELDADGCRGCW